MKGLYALERAVLEAMAIQMPKVADALARQQLQARVTSRENTGTGLYTIIDVPFGMPMEGVRSPLGDVSVSVADLAYGMGFMLWLQNGYMYMLEGYSYGGDSTSGLDFERLDFGIVHPPC